MRFKKSPQLPGAGRTRVWHHHGSHTPTSPGAILLSKMACQPKHIGRQCKIAQRYNFSFEHRYIIHYQTNFCFRLIAYSYVGIKFRKQEVR